jgi:hypothetical protein
MCAFLILSAFELETITLRGSVASHLVTGQRLPILFLFLLHTATENFGLSS